MTTVKLLLTAVLVAMNAFFVLAEYALVRSRRERLELLRDEGARGAGLAMRQQNQITEFVSAVQIGVTMTSIGIGALGEPALARALRPAFGGISHGVAVAITVALAYLMISIVQLVAGEMVPKFYAIDRAEGVARRVAPALQAFRITFGPFVVALTLVSRRLLALLGVDMNAGREGGTPEELKRIIAESYAGGQLDQGEAGMLTGVFHLHEQEARQVMTPIPAVVTVDLSEDVETAMRRAISSGHTRLVVTENDNRDRVRGLVHSNSLARLLMSEGAHATIEPLVHDAPIVPETKPLDDLLADLQRERSSMAVVVDEYGRVVGIVTVEDIIEEVVGEIADETDPTAGEIRRLANGDWLVRGHVAVTDLLDYGLELPVDTDAYNSVGGFVFAQLGRLPKRGDTVNGGGYSIRVESVRENRIEAVRIRERRPVPSGGAPGRER
ncbi:MAG TPA: hemolysin family protein [Solirubrobacteraceae bacterium]|jgi:CBS domain containing-hemolysin-like protein|nr:hemolysin family protein [Solirubrobacteraceae bacterium]